MPGHSRRRPKPTTCRAILGGVLRASPSAACSSRQRRTPSSVPRTPDFWTYRETEEGSKLHSSEPPCAYGGTPPKQPWSPSTRMAPAEPSQLPSWPVPTAFGRRSGPPCQRSQSLNLGLRSNGQPEDQGNRGRPPGRSRTWPQTRPWASGTYPSRAPGARNKRWQTRPCSMNGLPGGRPIRACTGGRGRGRGRRMPDGGARHRAPATTNGRATSHGRRSEEGHGIRWGWEQPPSVVVSAPPLLAHPNPPPRHPLPPELWARRLPLHRCSFRRERSWCILLAPSPARGEDDGTHGR